MEKVGYVAIETMAMWKIKAIVQNGPVLADRECSGRRRWGALKFEVAAVTTELAPTAQRARAPKFSAVISSTFRGRQIGSILTACIACHCRDNGQNNRREK